jgi:hypothetical protein
MSICRPCHHAVAEAFPVAVAVEPVPKVCYWATLKYDQEEIVGTVYSNYRHYNPDDYLLEFLDADAQEEKANANFEDRGAGDVTKFCDPPRLVEIRIKNICSRFAERTFMATMKFSGVISVMCRPVP